MKLNIIYNDNELILKPKPLEIKIEKLFDFDKKKRLQNLEIVKYYLVI
jgi:hypothetical protein